MTKTIQSSPCIPLSEEENMNLLISVFNSLNKLNDKLSKLGYVLKRKNIEQTLIFDGLNKLNEELSKLDCVPKEKEQTIKNQGEKK